MGKTEPGQGARHLARLPLGAHPVHARPAALRRRRRRRSGTGPRALRVPPGAVFTNLVLGDEINRASPKTQSALLEAMEERQVTVDGCTYPSTPPFMVMATQNPVEHEGTYPLPESQLDRFLMRITVGYPGQGAELAILDTPGGDAALETLRPVATARTSSPWPASPPPPPRPPSPPPGPGREHPPPPGPGRGHVAPGHDRPPAVWPGHGPRPTAAPTSCPTTSRRWRRPSSPTAHAHARGGHAGTHAWPRWSTTCCGR